MSYDLYFYKSKGRQLTEREISDYLTNNLASVNENTDQWLFQNKDTEVYFFFNYNVPENNPDTIEIFDDFENTYFSFGLNFLRPNFFGIEAFQFVEKFMEELDLFVIDPQSVGMDNPRKISAKELLATWGKQNLAFSVEKFEEFGFTYLPIDKSDDLWNYNYHRISLQEKLGIEYFVPRIFMMKTKVGNKAITVSTWTQHIPIVLPPADYFLVSKEYKKFFRTIKEAGLISYDALIEKFGNYFDKFDFKDCKIIHPDNAAKMKDQFNKLRLEYGVGDFCERIEMENLVNAKPGLTAEEMSIVSA